MYGKGESNTRHKYIHGERCARRKGAKNRAAIQNCPGALEVFSKLVCK